MTLLPYGYRPDPVTADALREIVLELFGNRTRLVSRDPLPYGADVPSDVGERTVIVASLAQTPEQEVHGGFLERLRERAVAGALLVVLDAAPFLHAAEVGGVERVAQRERAWARVLREIGLEAVVVPQGDQDAVIRQARRALWPRHSGNMS